MRFCERCKSNLARTLPPAPVKGVILNERSGVKNPENIGSASIMLALQTLSSRPESASRTQWRDLRFLSRNQKPTAGFSTRILRLLARNDNDFNVEIASRSGTLRIIPLKPKEGLNGPPGLKTCHPDRSPRSGRSGGTCVSFPQSKANRRFLDSHPAAARSK